MICYGRLQFTGSSRRCHADVLHDVQIPVAEAKPDTDAAIVSRRPLEAISGGTVGHCRCVEAHRRAGRQRISCPIYGRWQRCDADFYAAKTIGGSGRTNLEFGSFRDDSHYPSEYGYGIHLSMATVKDLSLMLNDSLAKYEGLNGQIVTEFTKRLASEKK
jgi:hypothetical protein